MNRLDYKRFFRSWLPLPVILIAMAAFFAACSDAPVAPSPSETIDPYAVSKLDIQGTEDFSEIPTYEEVVAGERLMLLGKLVTDDSTNHKKDSLPGNGKGRGDGKDSIKRGGKDTIKHDGKDSIKRDGKDSIKRGDKDTLRHDGKDTVKKGGGPGRKDDSTNKKDTVRHDGKDTVKKGDREDSTKKPWHDLPLKDKKHPLKGHSYKKVPAALNLTHEQDSLFRLAIGVHEKAIGDAASVYQTSRDARFALLNTALHELHDRIVDGTLTEKEARAQMEVLVAAYKSDVEGYGKILGTAVDAADAELDRMLATFLDAHQMELWAKLK